MATGMKAWIGALVVLCGLVAMWALPPSSVSRRTRARFPEETRYAEVAAEVQRAHGILVATRWSDSLSALVVESAVDGLALAHPPSEYVTPEGAEEWRQLVSARLDSRGPRDPEVTVGYVFQADLHGTLEGVLSPRFGSREQTYVGTREGTPYCFVVHPTRYALRNAGLRSARSLDGCDWYARYGVPGSTIGAWLEAGGFDFARAGSFEDLERPPGVTPPPFIPFGILRPFNEPIVVAACLSGSVEACERALTDPRALASRRLDPVLVEASPMSHMTAGYFTPFQVRSGFLLSMLEAEYGPEAFARFWSSNEPVPAAFEAAFGAELGTWVRDWAAAEIGLFRAGPAPHVASVGWGVLAVLLLSAFASLKQVRRRIG